jgi:hypothetical protein
MLPRPTIEAFDSHLADLGLRLEAVVIGGSALALLGVIARQTRDFDILAPVLPPEISEAGREFARAQRRLGIDLMDDWLNNGPMQVADALPKAWQLRTRLVFGGRALVLSTLGRADLLKRPSSSLSATAASTFRTASRSRRPRPSSTRLCSGWPNRTQTQNGLRT